MAGTWRIEVFGAEGLHLPSSHSDGVRHALHSVGARGTPARLALFELISCGMSQKTRRFEVLDDGSASVHEVLFVQAPPRGEPVRIRAIKCHKDVLIGEADVVVTSAGKFRITIKRDGLSQGAVFASISPGLSKESPSVPQTPPRRNGSKSSANVQGNSQSTQSAEIGSYHAVVVPPEGIVAPTRTSSVMTEGQSDSNCSGNRVSGLSPPDIPPQQRSPLPPPPIPPKRWKPLRKRHPNLITIGTCDLSIEAIDGLGQSLAAPHFIISLEGQEFRATLNSEMPLLYQFEFANLQPDLQIYCYDDRLQSGPVGRILIPLANLAWSAVESPGVANLLAVVEGHPANLQRRYKCQFVSACERQNVFNDTTHVDRYEMQQAKMLEPFGCVTLSIRLSFDDSARPLAKLYGKTLLSGVGISALVDDQALLSHSELPSRTEGTGMSVELQSLLSSLARLRLFFDRALGWSCVVKWLRADKWRRYVAGVGWFLFCLLGYFPPPLWQCPIYGWFAFLVSGLLAQRARRIAFDSSHAPVLAVGRTSDEKELCEAVREMELVVRSLVSCLERLRNLFTFGDGPASVIFFATVGALALLMSLSLFVATWIESVSFICGLYGALILIAIGKQKPSSSAASSPMLESERREGSLPEFPLARRLGLALELCVPDEITLVHRFIAARLQSNLPTTNPSQPALRGGSSAVQDTDDDLG
eukprot:TRINITY_DN69513_c0_g1_i1.p1 TRINITY_DN69513_c0_g1~~TRINITY_DN69513_c0_g1_i1.p1  ORF type:complete len:702 (-),score=86.37 TRINITY_DN69513_c0_g1_i1:286-2391(-)